MPAKIVKKPTQVNPPGRVGERIYVDVILRMEGEPSGSALEVLYEVQENHASTFQVIEGASRPENLQGGDNQRRHWFVVAGPSGNQVVDMRCVTKTAGGTRNRGFAVLLS